MPVERDDALKALHERIMKYRNAPQEESGNNLFWISQGARQGVGYFYALTPVYLANRLQALLASSSPSVWKIFSRPAVCRWASLLLMRTAIR
ncbi:sensor protein RcsC [Salmonella enterica subsp. enterica]|uniref:Sensor protein RcsC n=1 Tax=Salmonella enterica I TaxID=59201 RepID=A0A379W7H4_SALET|nr:sensor protein RcsC [Salmonella enterica subsp. enterica]